MKPRLPQAGLKVFGHRSHLAGSKGRRAIKYADKMGYFEWWQKKANRLLKIK